MNPSGNFSAPRQAWLITALLLVIGFTTASSAGEFSLKDTHGVQHTLAGLRGKWVLVNFWAPWCPACIQEMPEFNALQQQHQDVQVIGVAVEYQTEKEVLNMVKKQALNYPIVFSNESSSGDFDVIYGLPTSYLYSPDGKLIGHHLGPLTQTEIEKVMQQKPAAANLFTQ